MNKWEQTTPQAQAPPPPAYSDKSFLWSWVAGAGLPLVQAGVTGIIAMILTAVLIYAFDGSTYIKPMVVIGALAFTFSWLISIRRWLKLTEIEKMLHVDLNGGGIGKDPEPETVVWLNRVKDGGSYGSDRVKFPVSEEQITTFFTKVLAGTKPISRREWTPKKTNGFSDTEWRNFWGVLVGQGLVEGEENKYRLSKDGIAFGEKWLEKHSAYPVENDPEGETE